MASNVDIANLALSLVGDTIISDLSDTSDKASRVCNANFGQARDEALSLARWSFAKNFVAVSRLTDDPLMKWDAAFQLPTDFIRLCEIEGRDAWLPKEFFDVLGKKLVMNLDDPETTSVIIEYIRREEDPTFYSPLFVEALAYKLAIKIAVPLTGSDGKSAKLREEFERIILPRCMTIDQQQRYSGENHPLQKILRRSPLVRSRRGGTDLDFGDRPPGSNEQIVTDASDLDGILESNTDF